LTPGAGTLRRLTGLTRADGVEHRLQPTLAPRWQPGDPQGQRLVYPW